MRNQTIRLSDEDKSIVSPVLRPAGIPYSGLSEIKLYIGLSDLDISIRSPALRSDGCGLSIIKLSDYRILIKVSDPLLCLSVFGCEDSLNEADGSRLLDIKLSDYRIRIKISDPLLCLSVCAVKIV